LFYDARQKVQIVVKHLLHFIPTTLSQMIAGRQPVRKPRLGYMTTEPPNTKSDQPTLGEASQA
jgi:hypothetical protein